jgi:hypothetical protein
MYQVQTICQPANVAILELCSVDSRLFNLKLVGARGSTRIDSALLAFIRSLYLPASIEFHATASECRVGFLTRGGNLI